MPEKPLLRSSPETIRWADYESACRRLDEECAKLSPEEALKARSSFACTRAREAEERLQHAIEEAIFYKIKSADAMQALWTPEANVTKKRWNQICGNSLRLYQRSQYASRIAQRILRTDWKFSFFGPDHI